MHSLWLHFRLLHHQIRTVHRLVSFSDPLVNHSLVVPDAINRISVLCFSPSPSLSLPLSFLRVDSRTIATYFNDSNTELFIVFSEILRPSFSPRLSWKLDQISLSAMMRKGSTYFTRTRVFSSRADNILRGWAN